jgi:hypothetical protein
LGPPSSIGHIRNGELHALGVTAAKRLPALPDARRSHSAIEPAVERTRFAADFIRAGILHYDGAGPFAVLCQGRRDGDEFQACSTAAGIGVFVQNFCGAAFAQLYGLLADGTPVPLTETTAISASLGLVVGLLPFLMARKVRPASS